MDTYYHSNLDHDSRTFSSRHDDILKVEEHQGTVWYEGTRSV